MEGALAELAYAFYALYADGVVLYSSYAGIYHGDPRYSALFDELDRRGAVVFLHPAVFTGDRIPAETNVSSPIPTLPGFMLEFVFDTTRAVANLVVSGRLKQYPRVHIILAYSGSVIPSVAKKLVSGALLPALLAHLAYLGAGVPTMPGEQAEAIRQMVTQDIFAQLKGLYYDTALSTNSNVFASLLQLRLSEPIG